MYETTAHAVTVNGDGDATREAGVTYTDAGATVNDASGTVTEIIIVAVSVR